jgi:putative ABC transport system permease protein
LPLIRADLRRNPHGCAVIVALIALAVAIGATLTALERALRLATTRALPAAARAELEPVLGYAHDFVRAVPLAFDGLLVTAVVLIVVAHLSTRRREIGALRALGAPPSFLLVAIWLQGTMLIVAGALAGLVTACALAKAMAAMASAELGLAIDAAIGAPELVFAALLAFAGSLLAAAPSLPFLRLPAAELLRSA